MIRVNLLPAGMRKRQSREFNPESLLIVVGLLLVLAFAGAWAWLKYVRIPAAKEELKVAKAAYEKAHKEAEEVRRLRREIDKYEAKVDYLKDKIGRKTYWAETLDDLANQLGLDRWDAVEDGSDLLVSCSKLTLKEEGGGRGGRRRGGGDEATVNWSTAFTFELVGTAMEKRDFYIKNFYKSMKKSRFWQANGFEPNDPEAFYSGDSWSQAGDLGLVMCSPQELKPVREHVIQVPKLEMLKTSAAIEAEAEAAGGGRRGAAEAAAPKEDS